MKRGQIHIPLSVLDSRLLAAESIKAEMSELLRQLEENATKQSIRQPGKWRQDTRKWAKEHDLN